MLNIFSNLTIGYAGSNRWGLVSTNTETAIRYGVNIHIGSNIAEYGNESGVIDEIAALGFTSFRDNLTWNQFEPAPGVYTCTPTGDAQSQELFAALARNKAQNYGLHMTYGCLYGHSALYGSTPDATWRGHFVDAMEAFALAYIAAGYDPTLLTMELWNEPNGIGGVFENVAEADEYAQLLIELYARIKAVDSNIEICAPALGDSWWSGNLAWNQAMWGVSGWSQAMNVHSSHIYGTGLTAAQRYPEWFFFAQNKFHNSYLFPAAVLDGTINLLVSINETGWDTAVFTDATITKYLPRWFALASSLANLRDITMYELIETGNTYGISTSLGVRKTQATALAAMLVHLKLASRRSYYWTGGNHASGDHAVLLTTTGGQRLAVWTLQATRTINIAINTQTAGTLSVEIIGGATSTQALVKGTNTVSVELTDTAKVLFADVGITFPEFALEG